VVPKERLRQAYNYGESRSTPGMNSPARLDYASDRKSKRVLVSKGIRVKRVGKLNGMTVYTVNGEILRLDVDVDFTAGGNGARYGYVPINEIWLDKDMSFVDKTATLLHEYVEYDIMTRDGLPYDAAHDLASEAEHTFRLKLVKNPPKKIDIGMVRRQLKGL
jgi:hypothetical protein